MKHKVSGLEGALLDLAIYNAEHASRYTAKDLERITIARLHTMWSFCGPIIEREGIHLIAPRSDKQEWFCFIDPDFDFEGGYITPGSARASGPTPLIAAMRAFVASKLGEEVEL
jgi:hypothetical protein